MSTHPVALVLLFSTACATGSPVGSRSMLEATSLSAFGSPSAPRTVPFGSRTREVFLSNEARREALKVAQSLLGRKEVRVKGRRFSDDCTGLVSAVYEPLGVRLLDDAQPGENGVTAMYRFFKHHGKVYTREMPRAGDLVFFDETYDVNRDGRRNDGLTHVGIVEGVDAEGTVKVIHRTAQGVTRYHMNLGKKNMHRDDKGRVVNDYLRSSTRTAKPALTSQLFMAFGTLEAAPSSWASR